MRKHILDAKIFEENHHPKDAIQSYIQALKDNENFTDSELLDAIVLFFMAQEYAFIHQYNLDEKTQLLAWDYYPIALSKISKNNSEAYFWKYYIPFILLGEEMLNTDEIQKLLDKDNTVIIYMISSIRENLLKKEKIKELYEKHKLKKTERNRYIISIIEKYM